MRALDELFDPAQGGRRLVDEWRAAATNTIELLPCSADDGARCLHALQVTTRSPMGAIAHGTGGLLVDGGWVRVLGAGCPRLGRSLASWNATGTDRERLPGALLVADDAVGGFFALDGGRFGARPGSVHYFAPDSLRWEDLDASYSDWLQWLCTGDLARFYAASRWATWRADVAALDGDRGTLVYPFPCADGPPLDERSRSAVPIQELWAIYVERLPAELAG